MGIFGRREKKARSSVLAWSHIGAPEWTRRDTISLAREGFERNPVGYRCVRMIAEGAACVPYVSEPKDHDLARVLSRPNEDQTRAGLLESFFGHLQISGNAYLEAVLVEDRVRALYVLRPDQVTPIVDGSGWVTGWSHRAGGRGRSIMRGVDGWSSVFHMRLFHPTDDREGYSPLSAAARAIDIHNAGGAWAKALIDNSARPSGALIYGRTGERLSDDQYGRLKEELERAHSGASNAGRPLLLEGGLEWKAMSLSPAEMDYIEARHVAAREIALAFGVPPMLLGIPGDNTYSNYREANLAFWRLSILPLVDKAAAGLSEWLSGRGEGVVSFVPDLDRVPALSGERDALWNRLNGSEFVTRSEKRSFAGLPVEEEVS